MIAAYIGRWDIVRGHMADEGDLFAAFKVLKMYLTGFVVGPIVGVDVAYQKATARRVFAVGR